MCQHQSCAWTITEAHPCPRSRPQDLAGCHRACLPAGPAPLPAVCRPHQDRQRCSATAPPVQDLILHSFASVQATLQKPAFISDHLVVLPLTTHKHYTNTTNTKATEQNLTRLSHDTASNLHACHIARSTAHFENLDYACHVTARLMLLSCTSASLQKNMLTGSLPLISSHKCTLHVPCLPNGHPTCTCISFIQCPGGSPLSLGL